MSDRPKNYCPPLNAMEKIYWDYVNHPSKAVGRGDLLDKVFRSLGKTIEDFKCDCLYVAHFAANEKRKERIRELKNGQRECNTKGKSFAVYRHEDGVYR